MNLKTLPLQGALRGELTPPGDKSISHRALIFSSLADGQSTITGLLEAEDVSATAAACRQLGAVINIEGESAKTVLVKGVGRQGLTAPESALDMGNSGTAMRLLAGVLAAQSFASVLVGDVSLSRRPMRRIMEPLARMGGQIESSANGTAPLKIYPSNGLKGIDYSLPVASAQIKSCVLLAGLFASGKTCVSEPGKSRNHTELMLPVFGVRVTGECCVEGGQRFQAAAVDVPADISSAAFFMVAAAIVPDSDVLLNRVGMNPTRDGIIRVMQAMGADIELLNPRKFGQEPVADIRVRYRKGLAGIDIPEEWVPSLIDELPVIMVLATQASGTTRVRGAEELRVKESDRIAVMARGLTNLGVKLKEYDDGIDIHSSSFSGGEADGEGDHRCAMSFAVAGQLASEPVFVQGASHIGTSYPEFVEHLQKLGGEVRVQQHEAPAAQDS